VQEESRRGSKARILTGTTTAAEEAFMRNWLMAGLIAVCASTASAQQPRVTSTAFQGTPHYDVVLEVPRLSVDSIILNVDTLRARLSLNAQAANLVRLSAGAIVNIDNVELDIRGVVAEAYLYVDLDNVARVVDRVVQTLERNPEIVTQLLATVDSTVRTVGGVANTALQPGGVVSQTVGVVGRTLNNVTAPNGILSQVVNTAGQTVQRVLDSSGQIVEKTLNAAGAQVGSRVVGDITRLPLVQTAKNSAGQTVRRVRDTTGKVIEYAISGTGRVTGVRVLQGN
jgi:hypothetical protein